MESLAKYLERKQLTLVEFGELVGCGKHHISKLISGDRTPSLRLLKKIAEVTGIPAAKLLEECDA